MYNERDEGAVRVEGLDIFVRSCFFCNLRPTRQDGDKVFYRVLGLASCGLNSRRINTARKH